MRHLQDGAILEADWIPVEIRLRLVLGIQFSLRKAAMLELALELPPPGSRRLRRALHAQLRDAILDGRLAPGLRLPASRVLAKQLGLSRNSVIAAYDLLLAEGYLEARPGAGCFVARTLAKPPAPAEPGPPPFELHPAWREARPLTGFDRPVAADFRLGRAETRFFPQQIWARLAIRSLRRATPYYGPDGHPALREAIAGHISSTRAVACDPGDILVTGGAQAAFDLLARLLVTPERPVVAMEDPGYPLFRALFARSGAKIAPVPVDGEGIRVECIPPDASVIYVTPSHQFPAGMPMSPARRRRLLDLARRQGAVIIEDDYDSEFRFAGHPLDALQTLDRDGRVFYVGTFSKSLFVALRLGFIVAPSWALEPLRAARQMSGLFGAPLEQETLAAFIAEGHLARHARRMKKLYGERRRALQDALALHCEGLLRPMPALAGLHLSAHFGPAAKSDGIVEKAAEAGMEFVQLGRYAVRPLAEDGLAFGYGAIDADRIDGAIRTLARLLS
jgi:GntR family transcriptional regulator/MocR family aminotransferase